MESKLFEVRDTGTHMVVLAVRLHPANALENQLIYDAGYGRGIDEQGAYVVFASMKGGVKYATTDPHDYGPARTLPTAHYHAIKNWSKLSSGDVIDVEHILGERDAPKRHAHVEHPEYAL